VGVFNKLCAHSSASVLCVLVLHTHIVAPVFRSLHQGVYTHRRASVPVLLFYIHTSSLQRSGCSTTVSMRP
jgi:hypothetical protein